MYPRRFSAIKPVLTGLKDQIRILGLLPGKEEDEVECELRVVTLGAEKYEAVSYVWGDLVQGKTIKVDGIEQAVTASLYTALHRLRNSDSKRFLWVDQLCINQWDKKEKAHQVNLMQEIYKKCSRCFIWLGEIVDEEGGLTVRDAQGALDFVRFVAASDSDEEILPSTIATPKAAEGAKKAFEYMILHPWWSRIWTVQEAILPPTSIFIWGPLSISMEIMNLAAETIRTSTAIRNVFPVSTFSDGEVLNHFTSRVMGLGFTSRGESPFYILKRWLYRNATDPLDKVYALMGLFPDKTFPRVPSCDYELSPAALYTRITCDLIQAEWSLRPLIGQRGELKETECLPTWVPDLVRRHEYEKRPWMFWNHIFRYSEFSAAGNKYLAGDSVTGGPELRLRGVYVDTVVEVGEILTDESSTEPSDEQLVSIISSWKKILTRFMSGRVDGNYIGGGAWINAFWRTMLGDLIMDSEAPLRRATSSDRQQFDSFIENLSFNETYYSLRQMVVNQAFFITQGGYIGLGPPTVLAGDAVWVLFGANVPFVLSPRGDTTWQDPKEAKLNSGSYHFVGDAFVCGIMDGEVVEDCEGKQADVLVR
jgi:Heterokaryon incompatibility protein (HET)